MTRPSSRFLSGIWAIVLVLLMSCQTSRPLPSAPGAELGSESSKGGIFALEGVEGARAWSFLGIVVPDPKNFPGPVRMAVSFSPGAGDETVRVRIGDDGVVLGTYRPAPADPTGQARYQLAFKGGGKDAAHVELVTVSKDNTALMTSIGKLRLTAHAFDLETSSRQLAPMRVSADDESHIEGGNGIVGAAFQRQFRRGARTFQRVCRFQAKTVNCADDGGLIFTGTFAFDASTRRLVVHLDRHADRTYTLDGSDVSRRLLAVAVHPVARETARGDKITGATDELCGDLENVDPEDSESSANAGLWLQTSKARYRIVLGEKAGVRASLTALAPTAVCITPQKITAAPPPKAPKLFVKSYRIPR